MIIIIIITIIIQGDVNRDYVEKCRERDHAGLIFFRPVYYYCEELVFDFGSHNIGGVELVYLLGIIIGRYLSKQQGSWVILTFRRG